MASPRPVTTVYTWTPNKVPRLANYERRSRATTVEAATRAAFRRVLGGDFNWACVYDQYDTYAVSIRRVSDGIEVKNMLGRGR